MALFTRTFTLISNSSGIAEAETPYLNNLFMYAVIFRIPPAPRVHIPVLSNVVVNDEYIQTNVATFLGLYNRSKATTEVGLPVDAFDLPAWFYLYPTHNSLPNLIYYAYPFRGLYQCYHNLTIELSLDSTGTAISKSEVDVEIVLTDKEPYDSDREYFSLIPDKFSILTSAWV